MPEPLRFRGLHKLRVERCSGPSNVKWENLDTHWFVACRSCVCAHTPHTLRIGALAALCLCVWRSCRYEQLARRVIAFLIMLAMLMVSVSIIFVVSLQKMEASKRYVMVRTPVTPFSIALAPLCYLRC